MAFKVGIKLVCWVMYYPLRTGKPIKYGIPVSLVSGNIR